MRMLLLSALLSLSFFTCVTAPAQAAAGLPPRPANAVSGSQFAARIKGLGAPAREAAILKELTAGNVPDFLRRLTPVTLRSKDARGVAHTATVHVMPDYLAIGSDRDFVRIPMTPDTAQAFANKFGYVLPTTKIVDEVSKQASVHMTPSPLPAGRQMTSTDYYVRHQKMIEKQRARGSLGKLTAGQKKDVVISKRLIARPTQVAIYGWHRRNGRPVQPLSLVHGHSYADYSHGIRLVSRTMEVDGKTRTVDEVLADQTLAGLVSNEGAYSTARIAYAKGGAISGKARKSAPKAWKPKGGKKAMKKAPKKAKGKGRKGRSALSA